MFLTGVIMVLIGTAGALTAVGMEIVTNEPIYLILMKIFPWLIGIGLALIGLGFRAKRKG